MAHAWFCGCGRRVPAARPARVSTISGAPALARMSKRSTAVWCGADFDRLLEEDGAGVEALFKEHGGVAGEGVAIGYGPLDGRRATVLWQQRAVQVDAAEPGQSEHPRGDDAAVGYDDDRVGGDGLKLGTELGVVADFFRLSDGEAGGYRGLLDRRGVELLAAAYGAVWLRYDERDFIARREQCLEGGDGEAGCAAEDEFHWDSYDGHRSRFVFPP